MSSSQEPGRRQKYFLQKQPAKPLPSPGCDEVPTSLQAVPTSLRPFCSKPPCRGPGQNIPGLPSGDGGLFAVPGGNSGMGRMLSRVERGAWLVTTNTRNFSVVGEGA